MVTARIAGLSPGTSLPPVRIPIRPFLVLMRPPLPFCSSLQKETRRKRLRVQEPSRQRTRVNRSTIYHKPLMMHEEFAVRAGVSPAEKLQWRLCQPHLVAGLLACPKLARRGEWRVGGGWGGGGGGHAVAAG